MTVPRVVLLLCAVVAATDGAVLEAIGIAAFVLVLVVFWPAGVWQRPVPFMFTWRTGAGSVRRARRPKAGDFEWCECGALRKHHSKDPAAWVLVPETGCTHFRRRAA